MCNTSHWAQDVVATLNQRHIDFDSTSQHRYVPNGLDFVTVPQGGLHGHFR